MLVEISAPTQGQANKKIQWTKRHWKVWQLAQTTVHIIFPLETLDIKKQSYLNDDKWQLQSFSFGVLKTGIRRQYWATPGVNGFFKAPSCRAINPCFDFFESIFSDFSDHCDQYLIWPPSLLPQKPRDATDLPHSESANAKATSIGFPIVPCLRILTTWH